MAITPRSMMGLPNSPSFRYKALNPAYQSDPRRILGQSLMTQGASSAPVRTPLQGLGRLSSALVGAYLQKGAVDRQVAREDEYKDQLSNALSGMNLPANSPINSLGLINPELAINAAVTRNTNLELARQKTANKTPTFKTLFKEGETPEYVSVNSAKFNELRQAGYTDQAPKAPGSIGSQGNLLNEYLNLESKANKTDLENKRMIGFKELLAKERIVTVGDGQGGTKQIVYPGINVDTITNPVVNTETNNANVVENEPKVIGEKPAKLSTAESKFVGGAVSAKSELQQIVDILFNGDLENGTLNTSVVAALNLPGGQLVSGEAQKLQSLIFNLSDLRLRDKSGATAPEPEVKRYYNSISPSLTDRQDTVRLKIKRLVTELDGNINAFKQGRKIEALKDFNLSNFNKAKDDDEVEY
jgi:hypothetical protein